MDRSSWKQSPSTKGFDLLVMKVSQLGTQKRARKAFIALDVGAANLQAQWAGLQEAAERVVVRVLAGQSSSFLSQVCPAYLLPCLCQCDLIGSVLL